MLSAVVSAKFKVNKNKQNNQNICEKLSSLKKFLFDWREVLAKIVVPNQFPGFLFYVDKLARVFETWVKILQMMYSSVSCVIEFPTWVVKVWVVEFQVRTPEIG